VEWGKREEKFQIGIPEAKRNLENSYLAKKRPKCPESWDEVTECNESEEADRMLMENQGLLPVI
jgi:hypothetical protein